MARLTVKDKQRIIDAKVESINKDLEGSVLTGSLEENMEIIQKLFTDVDVLRVKTIDSGHAGFLRYGLIYCEAVVNNEIINNNIIRPLMRSTIPAGSPAAIETLMNQVIQIDDMASTEKIKDIVESITYGDTVLFVSGAEQALVLNTKKFHTRAITEPENERTLSGPREGFTESLMTNLSLLRRKVLSSDLKMKFRSIGRRTNTRICVCYMDGIVNKQILGELNKRLDQIDIDVVLDTNYITELIKDAPLSPFRTTGYTERPDVVIGKLMEGRIAVLLDGSPVVLTVPYLFIENFQSGEDYYLNYYYASFSRMLRIIGFFFTIAIPGIYIAIVAFHHEMMPLQLFISIAAERQSVPLPAALEAFIMLLVFDILRETGIRMPSNIGQALSIVGALVIGQASVEAKLVAAPMIIVVAFTGITNLLVPKMNAPVIYIRLALLILASSFGFFGLVLGLACILIHILNLRSFGVPQVTLDGKLQYQEVKDSLFRSPWKKMITRPRLAQDRVRMRDSGNGHE